MIMIIMPAVRADLRKSFDRGDWLLIPSTDVLVSIEERVRSLAQYIYTEAPKRRQICITR